MSSVSSSPPSPSSFPSADKKKSQGGPGYVIHFLHPASGRALSHVALAEGRVDLGTIARRFSLDPSSVRLNAHFISRDHLFLSALTWRQVIGFFQSRGFPSGSDALHPVLVDGRPASQPNTQDNNVTASENTAPAPPNLKRPAVEVDVSTCIANIKRMRQESPAAFSRKLKRDRHEDNFKPCIGSKRIRSNDAQLRLIHGKCVDSEGEKHLAGSKRHVAVDDILAHEILEKRIKEIKV